LALRVGLRSLLLRLERPTVFLSAAALTGCGGLPVGLIWECRLEDGHFDPGSSCRGGLFNNE
jgi:hypothetical protein